MKRLMFGLAAMAIAAVTYAGASDIPPHVEVITACQKVHSVYVVSDHGINKYTAANMTQERLADLAAAAPRSMWVEAGCSK